MIPPDTKTMIHLVIVHDPSKTDLPTEVLSGVKANESKGAVTPVRAVTGSQQFSCCCDGGLKVNGKDVGLCMTKHAGKLFEGAMHSGTDDVQFVNCPFCKQTKAYKEGLEEHERHTKADQGVFGRILSKA